MKKKITGHFDGKKSRTNEDVRKTKNCKILCTFTFSRFFFFFSNCDISHTRELLKSKNTDV